ncbi:hypothetical protein GCM10023196_037020 [Actinoallomurus vinaceus]|uniref:Uncharacterized protein n=1 Tax=Actinoallomurus vinaceus TaxID=1080074 RepID=A0ABP8U995_9ACTN
MTPSSLRERVRSAFDSLTERTIWATDEVTGGQPNIEDLHEKVRATRGPLRRLWAARALLRQYRPSRRERLALVLLSLAATISFYGDELERQGRRHDNRERHFQKKVDGWSPTRLLVDAIAVTLAAPQELWIWRITPWVQATFPRTCERVNWYLDEAAQSVMSALALVGVPTVVAASLISYLACLPFGRDFAYAVAIGIAVAACDAVRRWQRDRYLALKVRAKTASRK